MTKNNPAEKEPPIEKDGQKYRKVVKKSALPIWAAAIVWVIAALFVPMYNLLHILGIALVSAGVGLAAAKFLPKETVLEEIPFYTDNADLGAMVGEIRETLSAIGGARAQIAARQTPVLQRIDSITATVEKIRDAIIAQPSDLPVIRRFMNYYLPTTKKLIEKYSFLSMQDSDSENITKTAAAIENALLQIDTAFKHQLDALFADDALDISTDIEVLDALLTRDNLK